MQSVGIVREPQYIEPAGRPVRVLVFRSCRRVQFAAAVAGARRRHPRAEIVALTHPGHRESLHAAGVDRIVEVRGRRFGLLRTTPASLLRLRRQGFDEIVVPQMTAPGDGHGNLYRLAAALGARTITVIPGDAAPQTFSAAAFRRSLLRQARIDIAGLFQGPAVLLALLLVAWWMPRRAQRCGPRRRVLHIISSLEAGGAQRQLAELVDQTPADRYDVDVLVLGRVEGDVSRRWFARKGVNVAYLEQWPRLVSSTLEVRRHCRRRDYDVVHTWLFMANVIGVAGARLAGVSRVIASIRSLSPGTRAGYRPWWFRAADALASRAADVVTVNARALVADHGKWAWYPVHRIQVVHNGLEPSSFLADRREARARVRAAAGCPPDAVVAGTVGRLVPEKDHLTFLRVLHRLRQIRSDVHGVIVGDGPLRNQLEAAAAQMGLTDAVSFLGERDDARTLMAGFDTFLLTSTIEGLPNVVLEAAFLGVPAVASRAGGSPDVFGDLDDMFEPGDAAAAAERVLALIASPSVAIERVERMRRRAFELFTAGRAANQWFALYEGRPRKHEMHEMHETRADMRVFFNAFRVFRGFRG